LTYSSGGSIEPAGDRWWFLGGLGFIAG
jgi:hypothetical protein